MQHPEFEAHWNAINDILQKASSTMGAKRTELFRIREYKDGGLVGEEKGELDDELLVVDVERLNTKARETKFDGHAMQIGVGLANDFRVLSGGSPTPTPSPKPRPAHSAAGILMPQSHVRLKIAESENVMKEVDKELDETPTPTPSLTVAP